jgi:hypothetical protein
MADDRCGPIGHEGNLEAEFLYRRFVEIVESLDPPASGQAVFLAASMLLVKNLEMTVEDPAEKWAVLKDVLYCVRDMASRRWE